MSNNKSKSKSSTQQIIKIRLKAYDHTLIDKSSKEIVETAKSCFEAGADGIHAHVRGAQGQHLANDNRHVGALIQRDIAPTTFGVLTLDDKVHGFLQMPTHVFAVGHAINFGKEQRRECMAVHACVRM